MLPGTLEGSVQMQRKQDPQGCCAHGADLAPALPVEVWQTCILQI